MTDTDKTLRKYTELIARNWNFPLENVKETVPDEINSPITVEEIKI